MPLCNIFWNTCICFGKIAVNELFGRIRTKREHHLTFMRITEDLASTTGTKYSSLNHHLFLKSISHTAVWSLGTNSRDFFQCRFQNISECIMHNWHSLVTQTWLIRIIYALYLKQYKLSYWTGQEDILTWIINVLRYAASLRFSSFSVCSIS